MKHLILLCAVLGSPLWASQIQVSMFFVGGTNPGFFTFSVDGSLQQLLCDQFFPNVTTSPYRSKVATLVDLANTQLIVSGDPNALLKYQQVAILDLQAYADPTLAADVVRAARIIVDGSGPNTPGSQQLLDFVRAQNPANYDLTGFKIFTSPRAVNGDPVTQEITGVGIPGSNVPEPSSVLLFLIGSGILSGLTLLSRLRREARSEDFQLQVKLFPKHYRRA